MNQLLIAFGGLMLWSAVVFAQTVQNPAQSNLSKLSDSWPTYNGDYSGQRYSPLAKIDTATVKRLSPAWNFRVEVTTAGGRRISSTPLEVDGILYFTVPSHVWAVDARTGQLLWQFKAGSGIISQPVSYLGPDGKQYVAVMAGVGGWSGAIVAGDLDSRDGTAALGFVNAMGDLPRHTTKGGMLYVFALP